MVIDICGDIPTRDWIKFKLMSLEEGYLDQFITGFSGFTGVDEAEYIGMKQEMSYQEVLQELVRRAQEKLPPVEYYMDLLDQAGVQYTCTLNEDTETVSGVPPVPNDNISKLVDRYPDRILAFVGIDPFKGEAALAEMDRALTKLNFRGVMIVPFRNLLYANDPKFDPFYDRAQELGAPVWIHTSINYSGNASLEFGRPIYLDYVAMKFPRLKIIAGHAGWPYIPEMVAVAMRSKNIFIDISSFRPSYIAKPGTGWEMLNYFGSRTLQDQVVFGTEWPLLGFTLADLIREVRELPMKEAVKEKWLYRNAARLLDLPV